MSESSHKARVVAPVVDDARGRRRPIFFAGGALALLAAAGIGWSVWGHGKVTGPQRDHAVLISAAAAHVKAMPVDIATYGRVQTISSVVLHSRIDGVISGVHVREGQDVKVGDLLFTLDDREARAKLKQAEGAVARDKAQLENARRDLGRLLPLEEKSFVSKQQIDLARANVAALEGTLATDEAQSEDARVQLTYTVITAPIAGRIGSISSKVGNTVRMTDTQPLLTINQMRPIYIAISIPQADFPALQKAMNQGPVKVSASIPGTEEVAATGDLAFVENAIDNMTNTVGVKATVPNDDYRLWPGQLVDARITLKVEQNAVVVPSEAVQEGPNGTYVFVVGADNTAQMRSVEVNRVVGPDAVIAKGVAAGDRVVTAGQVSLEPGAKVRLRASSAAPDAATEGAGS